MMALKAVIMSVKVIPSDRHKCIYSKKDMLQNDSRKF